MPRLQIDVTDQLDQQMTDLMEAIGVTTKKDLFNNAISLLYWAVNEKKKGNIISSINEKTEKYRELSMPALDHVQEERPGAKIMIGR